MLRLPKFFSQRQREAQVNDVDVYQYDVIPEELRWKLVYCMENCFSTFGVKRTPVPLEPLRPVTTEAFSQLVRLLCERYGRPILVEDTSGGGFADIQVWLQTCTVEQVIDTVEAFLYLFIVYEDTLSRIEILSLSQVEENLNRIFAEHSVGYEFDNGRGQRVDSKLLHREVVKPALGLLYEEGFEGAIKEFETAHEHYRHGRYEDCLTQANNAFESTMKSILERIGHSFDKERDTASPLIDHCIAAQVIPKSFQSSGNAVSQVLKSSLPSIRSNMGAHGAGLEPKDVERSYAELALHLAATYIVFLVERYREMTG